jgi:hypothetical protein
MTSTHSLFSDAIEWVKICCHVCVCVVCVLCVCGHKTLPLYSVLGEFNVVHAVLVPFCDCCLIHAFVSEMVPYQELFRTKKFTHFLLLDMGCMSCPSYHP